jgi:hypothetical protein
VSGSPDYLEPFVGWKGLVAKPSGALFSPRGDEWPARERFEAQCPEPHKPADARCHCGVYAVRSFEELKRERYNWHEALDREGIWVVAEVRLWGQIRRGTIGYRAQFAYPGKVYIPAHKLAFGRRVRERYGCQIGIIDRFSGDRR